MAIAPRILAAQDTVRIRDLTSLRAAELEPLLVNQYLHWQAAVHWDQANALELVRKFVGLRSLQGVALFDGEAPVGYSYFVAEDSKSLIGDFYLRDEYRSPEAAYTLLSALLDSIERHGQSKRVEAQLMLLDTDPGFPWPRTGSLLVREREFLEVNLLDIRAGTATIPPAFILEPWKHDTDAAADLIVEAYREHVDATITDQYGSASGARKFLGNITRYPGCGSFLPEGSRLAYDRRNGRLCGLCMISIVAPDIGHVTQICVSPQVRGMGLGRTLLLASLAHLQQKGCTHAGLTVTRSNIPALRLYQTLGFHSLRRFPALVWKFG